MAAEWYYTNNRQQMGPVTAEELKKLAETGFLKPTDLVWKEGLANWVKASSAKGLFTSSGGSGSSVQTETAEPARRADPDYDNDEAEESPRKRRRRRDEEDEDDERPRRRQRESEEGEEDEEDDRPRRRRRAVPVDEDDEDEDDRPRRRRRSRGDDDEEDRPRRRRRRPAKQSSGSGLKIALGIGGGLLAFGLVIGAIVMLAQPGQPGRRTWSLGEGRARAFRVELKGNRRAEIRVTSNGGSDVDLYVFDSQGRQVAFDDDGSKDCFVAFNIPSTQTYKVEVRNMRRLDQPGRNGSNSGTLDITEVAANGPGNIPPVAINPRNPVINPPVINPPPINPPGGGGNMILDINGAIGANAPLDPKTRMRHTLYTVQMKQGKTYLITMDSPQIDCFLRVVDSRGMQIGLDDDGGVGLNSRLFVVARENGAHRIYASSLGNQPGNFHLRVEEK